MTTFTYSSPLHIHIEALIRQKRALGLKYHAEARILSKFDQFCTVQGGGETRLDKSLVEAWNEKRSHEAPATWKGRVHVVRQLGLYMNRVDLPAYVTPVHVYPSAPRYVPHIFSDQELKVLFSYIDSCRYCSAVPYRQWVMPLLFRLLYSSGLRLSEALHLRLRDVDLATGVLTIRDAKFNKDRLVPIAEHLQERCEEYVQRVHLLSDPGMFLFIGAPGRPLTGGNVYKNFRRFLWQAGISHGGWGKGPRVHDFRHTFAVHCLRAWVRDGKDLTAYLPILKTYLGHSSFGDTAYYLRLTAELYPDITAQMDRSFGQVIPVLGGDLIEAD